MKIGFVSQIFDEVVPPTQSSLGIWTYQVARRLARDDQVSVIARRPRGAPERVPIDGMNVDLVTCAPLRAWTRAGKVWRRMRPHANPLFAQPYFARDFVLQATRRLRRFGPDLIHVQNFSNHVPAFRRAFPDATIVLHMHCDWLAQLDYAPTARAIAAADLVVGCSRHVVEPARERFADLPVDFAVLPNGATAAPGASTGRSPETVLFVGRVSPEKGVHTLLEAWPRVRAARPGARLDILGPIGAAPRDLLVDLSRDPDVLALARFYTDAGGDYEAQLRSLIRPEDTGSVRFLGAQPHDSVLARCADATVLVNPSLSESFGMSLVEALLVETPVIATRAGGMPEVVEATGGGLVVEKNDPAALAEAIIALLDDTEGQRTMGRRGRRRVTELYSWERVADLTRDLHQQALAARRNRSA